jgi:N-acyl-D-aspartate/D-glutamate deacylase
VFEVVADFFDLDADFPIVRAMAEVSGRPMSITTLQRRNCPPDEYTRILGLIAKGVSEGVQLSGQVAARPVGIIMSLDGTLQPLLPSPTYHRFAHLPIVERVIELQKPEVRSAIIAELEALPAGENPIDRFAIAFAMTDPPRYDPSPDESLAAEAARLGTSTIALAYDTLVADGGTGMIYAPATNYVEGDMRAVRTMLTDPNTVPGLGDAGAHCTMICDGSFPTYLLSYWGLNAPAADRLPVEWIVKQQCADTADLVGLGDRGRLAPGFRADVNLIDPDTLSVAKPQMRYDLPARGKRLVQGATGYRATLVAGTVIARDGVLTGARPGRLVRGARALGASR